MEMYKWTTIKDVIDNISDEFIRIFKTEPNTSLYLFYENQWIFNFIEYSENNFNLDVFEKALIRYKGLKGDCKTEKMGRIVLKNNCFIY